MLKNIKSLIFEFRKNTVLNILLFRIVRRKKMVSNKFPTRNFHGTTSIKLLSSNHVHPFCRRCWTRILLSSNPVAPSSALRWLQTWVNECSHHPQCHSNDYRRNRAHTVTRGCLYALLPSGSWQFHEDFPFPDMARHFHVSTATSSTQFSTFEPRDPILDEILS